jgi:hypothetical protein
VLLTRPEDFVPKTKPGVYEKGVAPLYFHSHGHAQVADFFERGGQQYVYAEDLLLLEQSKVSSEKVLVPPAKILYGVPRTPESQQLIEDREQLWKKAHLLPIKVPLGTPELPPLENNKDAVLEAVRGGFSAAFDILAPIVGLDMDMTGEQAAELVFPDDDETVPSCKKTLLRTKLYVPGHVIAEASRPMVRKTAMGMGLMQSSSEDLSHTLLMNLPGFHDGRFRHLAKSLRYKSRYKSSLNRETLQ